MFFLLPGLSKGKSEENTLKLLYIDIYCLQSYEKLYFKQIAVFNCPSERRKLMKADLYFLPARLPW